jgi:hypothetical protein
MSDIAKLVLVDVDAIDDFDINVKLYELIRAIRNDLVNITDIKEADRRLGPLFEEMNTIYPRLSLRSKFYETYHLYSPPGTTQFDNMRNEIEIQTLKTEIETLKTELQTLKTELQQKKKVGLDKFDYMKCNSY